MDRPSTVHDPDRPLSPPPPSAPAILRTRRNADHGPMDPAVNRLDSSFPRRLALAGGAAIGTGLLLGASHGAQTSALRFRAENSHRLPTNERGWYLYHKSKNYYVTMQSMKEGTRMAGKLAFWTGLFFSIEQVVDRGRVERALDPRSERRRKDALSTVTAGLATSAAFSAWYKLPWNTSARMAKVGFFGGLAFGLSQDLFTVLTGNRLAYVDWVLRMTGYESKADQQLGI